MKKLLESCDSDYVMLDIAATTLDAAVGDMVESLSSKGALPTKHVADVRNELRRKEKLSNSAIGHSVAIPHAYLDCLDAPLIAIARLKRAINAGAADGQPVRIVFLLLGPKNATNEHLDSLASIARLMSDEEFRFLAVTAENTADFRRAVEDRMDGEPTATSPGDVDDGLNFSGRPFGGIFEDVRRRLKHYASDYSDGLHPKCVGSTLFLFFACLAPAIIFGGLMHGETNGDIGAVEMIVATCICGLCYAIFSGQPLIILGGTGPMLIFTGILFKYCEREGIPFLAAYSWVGLWTGLILVVLALTDASCLMRFFTRFTDEIFAALISVIFVYEALEKLIHIFHRAGEGHSIGYDVALLSLLLALGTFYIASTLSRFRQSQLLVPTMREFLADFGPTIAIISMALIGYYWRSDITLDRLPAPDRFQTTTGRPWFVPFLGAPQWLIWSSIVPASLCTVLVYLDQNITARLVNSSDNRLEKGQSYHLDLAVVGGLVAFCSVFGLPWLVAATVRSLNHVRSLATTEEVVDRSGRTHTRILHVRENRITAIAIHVLIGMSLLLLPLLQFIPLAVLFGLFLYMGVVSMKGNQFFERLSLWLTDPALYPSSHFVRRVPRKPMHAFTFIQLICLVVLWVVKTSAWGILFPLFISALVPVRFVLGKIFAPDHLTFLDAEEHPDEEEETWS